MHNISIEKLPYIYSFDNNIIINSIQQLYLQSFPKSERREWKQLIEFHNNKELFDIFSIKYKKAFIGFISLWSLDVFIYVEHFAIEDNFKNKGFGSNTLQILQKTFTKPIVLEVEIPNNELSLKRINFYKRNGFYLLDDVYFQPPYTKNLFAVEMKIMTTDTKLSFSLIQKTLYKIVYNQ